MRYFFFASLLLAAALPQAARAQTAKATASAPRTVLVFYLRLPRDAYFEVKTDRERIALTKREGGMVDFQNGYLRAVGNAEPDFQDNTTIHVTTPGGENPVYDLVWAGSKFRVQKPAPVPKSPKR